jgi:glyoxylase-like metal-dependent hydrolase (beta-lactamase superfamily II)
MSDSTTDHRPPTIGAPSTMLQLSDRVWVIPDSERTPHVPNVGLVIGDRAALIVDSGLGAENADRVFAALRTVSTHDAVYLTQTHFHPEHGYGAQRLRDRALIVYNVAQFLELEEKGQMFLELFRGFNEHMAAALADVEFSTPDFLYGDQMEIDLGGCTAVLEQQGPAHTRGDQSVFLPEERVLFTGDIVEERFFPILPDEDATITGWIATLERLERLKPAVVVPGHGAPGDFDLLRGYRELLAGWLRRARALADQGIDPEVVERDLNDQILSAHPDWDNREWVAPMIRKCLSPHP